MTAPAELSVSNLCWPDGLLEQVNAINTLDAMGVHTIDIAPAKAFGDKAISNPDDIDRQDLVEFHGTLRLGHPTQDFGYMRIAGLQSVAYGRTESIFSDDTEEVEALSQHMQAVIRLAEFVGARTVIYGAAHTRIIEGLTDEQANERAAEFFHGLNGDAYQAGVILGIEPVSPTYTQGRPVFGRSGADVAGFVSDYMYGSGAYAVNFVPDSFAMYDAGDDAERLISDNSHVLAPHAQISEPGMTPHRSDSPVNPTHHAMDAALAARWPKAVMMGEPYKLSPAVIALEMTPPVFEAAPHTSQSDLLQSIVNAARQNYPHSLSQE